MHSSCVLKADYDNPVPSAMAELFVAHTRILMLIHVRHLPAMPQERDPRKLYSIEWHRHGIPCDQEMCSGHPMVDESCALSFSDLHEAMRQQR
jgi:hypothetical protein